MTRDEALLAARDYALACGLPWEDPVQARRERAFIASGRLRWVVTGTHPGGMARTRIVIDERTRRIEGARCVELLGVGPPTLPDG